MMHTHPEPARKGMRLYCFDRAAGAFVKLA
jgi:hypothetical protein